MSDIEEYEFLYKPKLNKIYYSFFIFACLSIIGFSLAYYKYESSFTLSIFSYIAVGMFFLIPTLLMLKVIFRAIRLYQSILITTTSLSSPSSMIGEVVDIEFEDINKVVIDDFNGQLSLIIFYKNQKLIISEVLLKDRATFLALVKKINEFIVVDTQGYLSV
jgi:hypothetical protein